AAHLAVDLYPREEEAHHEEEPRHPEHDAQRQVRGTRLARRGLGRLRRRRLRVLDERVLLRHAFIVTRGETVAALCAMARPCRWTPNSWRTAAMARAGY